MEILADYLVEAKISERMEWDWKTCRLGRDWFRKCSSRKMIMWKFRKSSVLVELPFYQCLKDASVSCLHRRGRITFKTVLLERPPFRVIERQMELRRHFRPDTLSDGCCARDVSHFSRMGLKTRTAWWSGVTDLGATLHRSYAPDRDSWQSSVICGTWMQEQLCRAIWRLVYFLRGRLQVGFGATSVNHIICMDQSKNGKI